MEARLRPLSVPGTQTCTAFSLATAPAVPVFSYAQPGEMGTVHHFILRDDPGTSVTVTARSAVETLEANPFAGINFLEDDWSMLAAPGFVARWAKWLAPTPLVPLAGDWPGPDPPGSVFGYGQALAAAIYEAFEYVPGSTDITTPLAQFVAQHRGVCQDYAHLMLSCARAQGVPARYVSGYVYTGDNLQTHGAGATHAWVELYVPHAGIWKGFDPTNSVVAGDHHVKVAVGRDYADVPPTRGLLRGRPGEAPPREIGLDVTVQVEQEPE